MGTHTSVAEDDLINTLMHRLDRAGDFENIGRRILAQVLLGPVPGAVGADDDAFHRVTILQVLDC